MIPINKQFRRTVQLLAFMLLLSTMIPTTGCRKFIEVDTPATNINAGNVYTDNSTAIAVLTGIYARMSDENAFITQGTVTSVSLFAGLSADELTLNNLNDQVLLSFYRNDLTRNINRDLFWGSIYRYIFVANAALEGLAGSTSLSPAVKDQLTGEARFVRAFCYFYLTNLYGDVPLSLTTDWKQNALLPRSSQSDVYAQIIQDLKEAKNLLAADYPSSKITSTTDERVRPVKWAAAALLARVYLYTKDYANAEQEAGEVINQTALYHLTDLNDVFLKNSPEAIWQLQPVRQGVQSNTGEGALFVLPPTGPGSFEYPVFLNKKLLNSFEPGDKRKTDWINSVTVNGIVYPYPFKYKIGKVEVPTSEYIMMLRLGEVYLIRAEARAELNKLEESKTDLNAIRSRAGLPPTTANDKASLLQAILHERQVELFTEWGHRWFDLKRLGKIDEVMSTAAAEKGGSWQPYKALYPIPQQERDKNPNLSQNSMY